MRLHVYHLCQRSRVYSTSLQLTLLTNQDMTHIQLWRYYVYEQRHNGLTGSEANYLGERQRIRWGLIEAGEKGCWRNFQPPIRVFSKWSDFRLIRWIWQLDRITHIWIRFNYKLTQAQQKHFSVKVREVDSWASDLVSIPGQAFSFFCKFYEFV